jgi:hypothetical protein
VTTDTNRSQEAIRVLNEADDGYTAIVNHDARRGGRRIL